MGDISAEPSMEEILSSIKRIIAEEGDGPTARRRAPARPSPVARLDEQDEVLELSDPMPPPMIAPDPAPQPVAAAPRFAQGDAVPAPATSPANPSQPEPIVSAAAVDATRGALESLSRMMIKPETNSDGTLEGLVRDMLRPMLREWLDAHLPDMVESMVAREIARISGQAR